MVSLITGCAVRGRAPGGHGRHPGHPSGDRAGLGLRGQGQGHTGRPPLAGPHRQETRQVGSYHPATLDLCRGSNAPGPSRAIMATVTLCRRCASFLK